MDGLERDLVLKWRLKNLIQKTWGSIKIPEEYYSHGVPYTPVVWTSFITGKRPKEHGVDSWWTYPKLIDWIRRRPPLIWIKNKRKYTSKIIKPKVVMYKGRTIFDEVKPSKAIAVAGYNSPQAYHRTLSHYAENGEFELFADAVWRWNGEKAEETLRSIVSRKYRLIMVWLDIADVLGHLYFIKRRNELKRVYSFLDDFAGTVQVALEKGEGEGKILIVSDHGMEPSGDGVTGNHSDHNFWSVNFETDWRPNDVVDFYPKLVEWSR